MVHLGFQGREHSPDFLLFLKPEEPSILYHHSWRCYRTPAEVVIQQENHLSMLVISDCKQVGFILGFGSPHHLSCCCLKDKN